MKRALLWAAALALGLGFLFAACEAAGWPFLAEPLQHYLQNKTGRSVQWGAPPDAPSDAATAPAPAAVRRLRLQLWGGLALHSPWLQIAAPAWSDAPFFVNARDVQLQLHYGDAWRALRGAQLVIQVLQARTLEAYLQRGSDGRATWQLGSAGTAPPAPRVVVLALESGRLHYQDAPLHLALDATLSLSSPPSPEPSGRSDVQPHSRLLVLQAKGQYRQDPFTLQLRSSGALPWEATAAAAPQVELQLDARLGRSSLAFVGQAQDLLHLGGLNGSFTVQGPTLAALGEPLGLTLPSTHAFRAQGTLQRNAALWQVQLASARVGDSQVDGDFVFDTAAKPAKLTGRLHSAKLLLKDLGPAVGAPPNAPPKPAQATKVLPTRALDLASLHAMDANVTVAIAHLDLNTPRLEPLRPFHARVVLSQGVLTVQEIDARTAQGHLGGTLALVAQDRRARWIAALHWDGVQLQQWLRQRRGPGAAPYVSGELQGHAKLEGTGRSTAEILATLQGQASARVLGGRISHLLVELSGLDLAEALGLYVRGDKALALDCAVADLVIAQGLVRPRVLVLDTRDSTLWVDGSLSLARESLDLRVVVAPKDFSPLTLRAPLRVAGSFAQPAVSIERSALGLKLGSSLLLGLLNPLAAWLPLLDTGDQAQAAQSAADCRARTHQKLQRGVAGTGRAP